MSLAQRIGIGLVMSTSLVLAACGASASPSDPAPTSAPVSPTPSVNLATPSVSAASASPSGRASSPAGAAVPIDPDLLAILPSTVAGQSITEIPEIEANLVTDPDLEANAASLAVALGINSATGDFAYVAVIQLKPLVFTNAWYVSWRDSYDQGACSQSSGLKSTSSATIGGWPVFIGTCAGGAMTYQVHMSAPDRVVSITSVGTADFGAQVVASLKP